jgi:radical SAM protein with 4Fe4S-binding SPASM domain
MKHNEKELPLARKLAEELNVDFFTLKTVDMHPSLGENLDNIYIPENQKYRRYEYESGTYKRKQKSFTCMRPWKRITIDALGEIIMCEYEYKDLLSFGNLNTEKSAVSIWGENKAKNLRRKFNLGNNDFYLCKDCTYKNRVANDCTVELMSLREKMGKQ